MKTYKEQRYPHTQLVKLSFIAYDGEVITFEDEHKGLNKGHALHLARINWPGCVVEAI